MIIHAATRQESLRTGNFEERKVVTLGNSSLDTLNSRFVNLDLHVCILTRILQDHVTYLRRTRIGAAVGTPGRIGKLLELGEFRLHLPVSTLNPSNQILWQCPL